MRLSFYADLTVHYCFRLQSSTDSMYVTMIAVGPEATVGQCEGWRHRDELRVLGEVFVTPEVCHSDVPQSLLQDSTNCDL